MVVKIHENVLLHFGRFLSLFRVRGDENQGTALSEILATRPNLCFFIQNKENKSKK